MRSIIVAFYLLLYAEASPLFWRNNLISVRFVSSELSDSQGTEMSAKTVRHCKALDQRFILVIRQHHINCFCIEEIGESAYGITLDEILNRSDIP